MQAQASPPESCCESFSSLAAAPARAATLSSCVRGTPPLRLRFGCIAATSTRAAHVCAQRTSGDECTYVASPPGPVRQQWQNAIAHGTPPSLLCPSPLGPAVAEHTRMRQCGPPPAPLALTAPRGSGSSLHLAAAAAHSTRQRQLAGPSLVTRT